MFVCFFFQAEDGIRVLVRSRGLGDVYKRQLLGQMTHMMVELYNDRPQVQGLWLVIGLVTAMSLMDGSEHHVAQPAG